MKNETWKAPWNPEVEYVWPAYGLGALMAQFDHYFLAVVNRKPMFIPALYRPQTFQGRCHSIGHLHFVVEPPEFVENLP